MARNSPSRPRFCRITPAILLALCAAVPAAEDAAGTAVARLLAIRDGLHTRLRERMRADAAVEAPVDVALLLENGLEHHGTRAYSTASGIEMIPLHLRLGRRGGAWLEPRVRVPGELGGWMEVMDVETGDLGLTAQGLSGTADLIARLGRPGMPDLGRGNTSHGHLKSGTKPVLEWHILQQGVRPHAQRFAFDARVLPDHWNFRLTFHDALRGSKHNERIQQTTEWSHDLHLRRFWLREDFAICEGRSPSYNKAIHTHDPAGLRLQDGRLVGTLVADLQPDNWVKGGTQTYEIEADLSGGRLVDGRYRVSGEFGTYEGRVSGELGRALAGRYRTAAYGRARDGMVMGTLVDAPAEPEPIDAPGDAERLAATTEPAELVALGCRLYRETAGLIHALRAYPRPWHTAAATQAIRPPLDPDEATAERFLAGLVAVAERAEANIDAEPAGSASETGDPDFGPYFDAAPLPPAEDGVHHLPPEAGAPGPQRWQYLRTWQVVGPFVTHAPAAGDAITLPGVVPAPGLAYAQDWRDDGRVHLSGRTADLGPATPPDATVRLPRPRWEPLFVRAKRLSTYGDHMAETKDDDERQRISEESQRAFHWYARGVVRAERPTTLHLGVRGKHGGQVWVNGRLCWRAGQDADSRSWSVFPVALAAGENEILIRAEESISYYPGWGKGWTPDKAAAARSWLRVLLCTRGEPRATDVSDTALNAEVAAMDALTPEVRGPLGDGTARFPAAEPPLVWDLEAGINVAWKRPLPVGAADPVVWEDRLLIATEPAGLHCLDRITGEERWSVAQPGPVDKRHTEDTAAATPLVDAGTIWVHYGTGRVAAYTHDGSERWTADTGAPWSGLRGASPVLAGTDGQDRRILALVAPDERRDEDGKRQVLHQVIGLNADTGQELWRRAGLPRPPVGLLHLPLVQGEDHLHTLVDADGAVLAAPDGRILRQPLDPNQWGKTARWSLPPRRDRSRVLLGHAETGLRIWLEPDGQVGRRIRYHHNRGSGTNPVVAPGGLLYMGRVTDEHSGHGPTPWDMVQVIDTESGFTVAKHKPALRDATKPVAAALVSEDLLYLTDNGGGIGAKDDSPKLGVLQAGEIPRPVVDQGFIRTRSHPVFAGERMYMQGQGAVWCLAALDDRGRLHQEETVARNLIRGRLRKPAPATVTDVPPLAGFEPPAGLDVARMGRYSTPNAWLRAGPFPLGDTEADPLTPFAGETALSEIRPGSSITWSGVSGKFTPVDDDVLTRIGAVQQFYQGERSFRSIFGLRYVKAVDCAEYNCSYYLSMLEAPLPATYRVRQRSRGVRTWLSGVPIEHEQDLRLGAGFHPLLVRVDIGKLPPFSREWLEQRMLLNVIFRRVPDHMELMHDWREELRTYRPWLARAIERLPDSPLSRTAKIYLRYADGEIPLTDASAAP